MKNTKIKRAAIEITERCTLKCKLCAGYVTHIKNPVDMELEFYEFLLKRLFENVHKLETFSLSGGEALMHSKFNLILEKTFDYNEQYEKVLILSNGTLIPKEETINLIKNKGIDKVQFNISNYGQVSRNVNKLIDVLSQHNISYREIKYYGDDAFCGGWVDYGDHTQNFFTDDEVTENAKKCTFRDGFYSLLINKGGFFHCGRSGERMRLGVIEKNPLEYISLEKDYTQEEFDMIIDHMFESPYLTACKYCTGLTKDTKRYPAAEQI